jgi:hypothetical protein
MKAIIETEDAKKERDYTMKNIILLLTLMCFCFVSFSRVDGQQRKGQQQPQQKPGRQGTKPMSRLWQVTRKTPIPDITIGGILDQVISPDNRRVAYKVKHEGKFSVVVDGVTGDQYDDIADIVFSPDSRKVAYFASFSGLTMATNPNYISLRVGGWWTTVTDGVEGPFYVRIARGSLRFSPDGQRLAYAAQIHGGGEGSMAVSADETNYRPPKPNGRRIVESSVTGKGVNGNWAVVVNGKPGDTYEGIAHDTPVFSPDSRRIAYGAERSHKWYMVIDGIASSPYYGLASSPIFSPDSQRVAFGVAKSPQQFSYVIDGSEQPGDYSGISDIVFSSDSKRVAYAVKQAGRFSVIADKIPGTPYDAVHKDPFGFMGFMTDGNIVYGAQRGKEWLVVRGSEESRGFDAIGALTFSLDHSRFAFVGLADGAYYVVVNGLPGGKFDRVSRPVFSQDGKRLAYNGVRGDRSYFVIDGKETEIPHRVISNLTLSPSGAHWAYTTDHDGKLLLIVDGTTVGTYDGLMKGSTLRFTGESLLSALVGLMEKRLRVEISRPAGPR